jgi:serine/threonine protein kinase
MMNPAENLVGRTLINGWTVTQKLTTKTYSTGGNFSICYLVERDKEIAFLKALDISRIFKAPNFMKVLEFAIKAHNYECDILKLCAERRMSKIVNIIEHGEILADPNDPSASLPVHYLVFELADKSVRDHIALTSNIANAWLMRSVHNVAVGLSQLHKSGIAHQDVKPSNVLFFEKAGVSKIGDLGRAEVQKIESVYVGLTVAGDPDYAPPELLYDYRDPDWNKRRKATDLYHLGSLLIFYYMKSHMTALLKAYLPSTYHWRNWSGDYRFVLPYINEAYETLLNKTEEEILRKIGDAGLAKEIITIIKQLCHPDPDKRGHPQNRMIEANKYSLERYITLFARLTQKFEIKVI